MTRPAAGSTYPVIIEALSSLSNDWREVLSFDLQLGNLINPANYTVYTNQRDYLSDREFAEGAENLAELRKQWGLDTATRQPDLPARISK